MSEIQHYNPKAGLSHPLDHKVQKLLKLGCLQRIHGDFYRCTPIIGYNSTTYELRRDLSGRFNCNCQGYGKNKTCSHLQALEIKLKEIGDQKQGSLF